MFRLYILVVVKRRYHIFPIATLAMFSLIFFGCEYNVEEELYPYSYCDTTRVASYSDGVRFVLEVNCDQCHGGDTPSAGFVIDTYETLTPFVENGSFLCSIEHGEGCLPMPDEAPKISDCDINLIKNWIDEGAQND